MSNHRPVKTKDFEKFVEAHNCKYKGMNNGSHAKYKCPGCWRSLTYRPKDKEIPPFHLQTNLDTMGLTMEYFYKWVDENC